MKHFEWLDSYIEERQKYIDIILANKKINGVCDITIEEIASKMNRSITTVKNKIKSINEDEEIIKQIGRNEFIIKKENFANCNSKLKQFFENIMFIGVDICKSPQ